MHDIRTVFRPKSGLTSIDIDADGISIVQIQHNKNDQNTLPIIAHCLYRKVGRRQDDLQLTLQSINSELGLKRSLCTTVLSSDHYKLLLTDKPNVPDNELAAALSWQVKDMIDKPIEETTFEVFLAPEAADTTKPTPAYVLAADNNAIQQCADLLTEAKINLHCIDIHEMALRNLIMIQPEPEQAKALLWLDKKNGTLIIVRDGAIYMCRAVGVGMDNFLDETRVAQENDSLMLEIQRSLDYYEARYQAAPIRNIMLAPGITTSIPSLSDAIQQTLGIEAQTFNLDDYLEHHSDMPDNWQQDYFISIGAALRQEEAIT